MADDLTKLAHHVLSRNLRTHRAIQKAAKSKTSPFHIDEFLNGISVDKWRNQPNHLYDRRIRELLDAIPSGLSPEDTFSRLELIIKNVKEVIKNNPNTHLNDLIF
ncbi:AHH domain-containing protein [Tenacibaculum ascidiaceicola]|uniref:AHH domain-containing protein n=1 Tax=Tenacibaculum ascidiaceicola TaxID=1699411 RepID=UPI003CE5B5B2